MKRLEGQKKILAESKQALDDALAHKLVAVATALDAKCKRQAAAVAATQAMIVELEQSIQADEKQADAFKEPPANVTPHKRR